MRIVRTASGAAYVDGELVAVTVYSDAALDAGGPLERLWPRIEEAEGRIRFEGLEASAS